MFQYCLDQRFSTCGVRTPGDKRKCLKGHDKPYYRVCKIGIRYYFVINTELDFLAANPDVPGSIAGATRFSG
jgi:hypothetical protein